MPGFRGGPARNKPCRWTVPRHWGSDDKPSKRCHGVAVSQKCQIPANPFSGKCATNIQGLWSEYTMGSNGQPSIRQLEHDHGDSWKFWNRKNEELVFDTVEGKILRLSTDPIGFKKNPLKTKNQWQDCWYKFSCVINRLKLYEEVLMGPDMQMSQVDAGQMACRILEREMAKSELRTLKKFSEAHLRATITSALKVDTQLPEKLKKLLKELDNVTATSS